MSASFGHSSLRRINAMPATKRLRILAAILICGAFAAASARADVTADAKKSERELIGLQQQYQGIVAALRAKAKALPPALSPGLTAVIGKAEQCLTAIGKARAYARKIQSGKPSKDSAKILKQHMQYVQKKQDACNAELARFSKVAQDYLSAARR
jgi:hypothetical protein